MSGNLKILVHKSWHVWKRENREKVARDERNFKEECERKEDRERSLTQEKNLEILQESGSHQRLHNLDQSGFAPNYTEGIIVEQPFRLFGDIEELDKKTRERNDQLQAKKDKEFQEKKRSGEAPWALGEGAAEKIGSVVPYWYARPSVSTSSSSVKIKSEWGEKEIKEEKTMEREEIRKNALDPMNGILKTTIRVSNSILIGSEQFDGEILKIKEEPRESPAQYSPQVTQSSTSKNSESRRNSIGGKNNYDNVNRINKDSNDGVSNYNCQDSSGNTDYIGNKRPNKKTSHSDREKKRKRTREYSDNDSNNSSSSSSGVRDSSSSSSSGSHVPDMYSKVIIKGEIVSDRYETKISDRKCTNDSNTNSSIALLRLKRIEREYVERKRAALLLAKVDIYGPPLNMTGVGNLPDGREQRYHQQFHPHIAR